MYFLMIAAILHQYEEQPLATAEEQQRCMTLLAHPEDAHEVQPLTFRIDPLMGQRDYVPLDNIPGGILCSQRFLALLMSVKADCFVFPALLRDLGQEQERAASYHFVVPRRYDQTIDWERSESWVETESESGGHSLTKLVLTEECEAQQIPLFRPEHTLLTVVHDHLRTTVEQAKLVGVAFAPLTALYSPHQGVRLLELERLLRKRPHIHD